MAVICPLEVTDEDRAWIEDVRSRHDPQHGVVAAHFTLVFPMTGVSSATFSGHVEQIAGRMSAIDFRLSSAVAARDGLAPRSHVFLLPDAGDADIRRLHAALYAGRLASGRSEHIAFDPHVTVAAFETQSEAESLSRRIGAFEIRGRLRTLAVMSVGASVIRQEREFRLL